MEWSNYTAIMNLFSPTMVVSDVIIPLFVGAVGGIVVFAVSFYTTAKNAKQKLDDEKSNVVQSLLPEIDINQSRLQPLSECVDKVLDNENHECSETESTPKELNLEKTIYDSLLGRIGLLDNEIVPKVIKYYADAKKIEEEYKKLEVIHCASHGFLDYLIIKSEWDEHMGRYSTPSLKEIVEFLRHTKQVYDLGEELTQDLKK